MSHPDQLRGLAVDTEEKKQGQCCRQLVIKKLSARNVEQASTGLARTIIGLLTPTQS